MRLCQTTRRTERDALIRPASDPQEERICALSGGGTDLRDECRRNDSAHQLGCHLRGLCLRCPPIVSVCAPIDPTAASSGSAETHPQRLFDRRERNPRTRIGSRGTPHTDETHGGCPANASSRVTSRLTRRQKDRRPATTTSLPAASSSAVVVFPPVRSVHRATGTAATPPAWWDSSWIGAECDSVCPCVGELRGRGAQRRTQRPAKAQREGRRQRTRTRRRCGLFASQRHRKLERGISITIPELTHLITKNMPH